MRFIHLETASFGPLEQRSFEVDSDIVLVCGENEAGKSSFRAAIETLLYGFKPADRELHPLAQWDPDDPQTLQIACEIRLGSGERVSVERVLQSAGRLRIAAEGMDFSGPRRGNRALPWVEWLSREVFCELYSLELAELAELDSNAQADIDDLLMPRTSALPLRSAAEIRDELSDDCENLWRPDKRGKPAARVLRERLKAARERLGEAQQRDRALRDARSERAEVENALESLRARKRELERENADAPFLGELFEWTQRTRALGPMPDLAALGDLPLVKPSLLTAEIEELQERLRGPLARLAEDELSLAEPTSRILECSTEIGRALEELPRWNADRERLAEQNQDAEKARERARDELRSALSGEPSDADLEAAAAVPIEALASAATEWSDARERNFEGTAPARGSFRALPMAAGWVGFALIALGIYSRIDPRLTFDGAAFLGTVSLGAALLIAALFAGIYARPRDRGEPLGAPVELEALLGEIAFPQALLTSPAALQRLTGVLVGIQRSLGDARERERLSGNLATANQQRVDAWKILCGLVGVNIERDVSLRVDDDREGAGGPETNDDLNGAGGPETNDDLDGDGDSGTNHDLDGDGGLFIARLRSALESARAEYGDIERDQRERDEAQRLIAFEKPTLDGKLAHREKLQRALRAVEPDCGDLEEAHRRVEERRSEAAFLIRRKSELCEDPRFATFEDDPRVRGERPPEDAPWLPDISATRDQQLSEFDERLSSVQHRLGQLAELLSADDTGAVSDSSDAVREILEALAFNERERDRLALLESIVTRAEREFRELHQPDVLRRASAYLDRVTNGRYRRIDLLDDDEGLLGVTLDGRSEPIEVGEPISRGTLDQIFLCLRLGMLDHLDEGRERLPLILDDALLRMDDRRRRGVYALLGEMAPTRQVWILTCHRALADEVESGLKVSRIDL